MDTLDHLAKSMDLAFNVAEKRREEKRMESELTELDVTSIIHTCRNQMQILEMELSYWEGVLERKRKGEL